MAHARIRMVHCACGAMILLVGPGPGADLLRECAGETYQVLDLRGCSGECTKCGRPVELPPAEVLDDERTPLGRWLKKWRRR